MGIDGDSTPSLCDAFSTCQNDESFEFQDGDVVVLSKIYGMIEMNDEKPRKVKNGRAYSASIYVAVTLPYERPAAVLNMLEVLKKLTIVVFVSGFLSDRSEGSVLTVIGLNSMNYLRSTIMILIQILKLLI
ncbi:hypothetical protein VNO77_33752 [Canavalia gladiata]|uniref:Ubiquitin-activating enzyme E1 FCCH domain-containing protein n=1 Tax=Canavalia gladiata TaxID=3824 RepID=A0AAN9PWN4_CANGL